ESSASFLAEVRRVVCPHSEMRPRNVGQYIWDRINPNSRQWQSGVRFMYFLLSHHKNNPELRQRVMESIGAMYFRFFQDYARAAYWWEKSGVRGSDQDAVGLAECYFRLGNKEMAQAVMKSSDVSIAKIKLLGEMEEIEKALQMADSFASWTQQPQLAYLNAGDICRLSDQFERAIIYYQKVLTGPSARNAEYDKRYRGRAEDSIEFIKRFELLDIGKLADGLYRGSSIGYEAPIHIEATVKSGRIEKLEVTDHREKQYYSALRDVPSQIIRKQNLKDVDATSRATITAVAIINATAKALTTGAQP
ncbi:MAG: FMN-binding protein, partial [Verrucomicrobia bacterium]|nr:FMN-binding protein [Verrucomicrobiota bacterium]